MPIKLVGITTSFFHKVLTNFLIGIVKKFCSPDVCGFCKIKFCGGVGIESIHFLLDRIGLRLVHGLVNK